MLWVCTILLLALMAVAACMAWLRSVNRRTRSQEQGTVPSPARDEGRGSEVETTASGPTAPPADEFSSAGTQLPVASETEPTALQRQTRDASESPETNGHEPEAASPQERSSPATESVSVEVPSTEIPEVEHEVASSSLVGAGGASLTAKEIPAEQHEESDQESDDGIMTVSVEEAHPPIGEALPTSGSERTETDGAQSEALDTSPPGGITVAVEQVPRVDNEPELEKPKQDARVRPPLEFAQPESPPTHPRHEAVTNRATDEGSPTVEAEEVELGASPATCHDEEAEEHDEATRKTVGDPRGREPSEAAVPVESPLAHDVPAATAERPRNELPERTSPLPRPRPQKKRRRQKPRPKPRKRDTRKRQDLQQVEDKAEDARLLAEVSEIPEGVGSQRPQRPPRPSRYRPPSQEPLTVRQSSGKRQTGRQARQQNFDLTVRLLFQRSGHFSLGLLPQRDTDLPEEIVIGAEGNHQTVAAVHDDWYEDIYPEDLASLLASGIVWEGRTESEILGYWRLSGRDLHVLATHDDLRGFAQTTRLKIGRVHVILCRNALLAQVRPVLQQTGCTGFEVLEEGLGAPPGWTVIRDVVPKQVGRVDGGPEILTILQPEPALEIELKGGIYLQQGTWLYGFPPRICVSGDMQPGVEVFIDGKGAIAGDDGSFAIQGYDTVGEHIVSIPVANTSRTYRITEGDQDWALWDAHSLSRASLCGPLLRAADTSVTPRAVLVPSSNSVILGPTPGDIAYCPRIPGPKQVGCVSFDAVWAIPYDAFGCRKATTTIRLLSARRLVRTQRRHFTGKEAFRVLAWCTAILNASRKGLNVDATDPHGPVLWGEYKAHARALWKKLKK